MSNLAIVYYYMGAFIFMGVALALTLIFPPRKNKKRQQ